MKIKIKIRPVDHSTREGFKPNRFCGPSAISAATGITTGRAASILREVAGKKAIMGTMRWEMAGAFRDLGVRLVPVYNAVSVPARQRPTLTSWLASFKTRRKAGVVFLIEARNHWQLVEGRRYVCGQTGEIVSVRDKRVGRRARVAKAWELVPR